MLTEAASHVVAALVAAGIPATTDRRDLTIPGALVVPQSITYSRLALTSAQISCEVTLVVPSWGAPCEQDLLSELIGKAAPIVQSTRWEIEGWADTNQSPEPLAAATTTIIIDWSK